MKTILLKISTGILLLSGINMYGQKPSGPYMDSVFIHIENRMEITLSAYDYRVIKEPFKNDLSGLRQILMLDTTQFDNFETYRIEYVPQKKLTVQPADKNEMIIFNGNKLENYRYKNQCTIHSDVYDANIRFIDISDMTDLSNLNVIMQVFDSLPEKSRWAGSYHFDIADGHIRSLKNADHHNGPMDMLNIRIGAGTGVVKNQLTTDLSVELGLQFSKKGMWKNQYYISDNLFYFFDNNGKILYNNFINLGYRYNYSKNPDKTNWFGIELGYLTNRNGNFFDKNTFRLGVNWDIGRYMSVSPCLYISDNFNKMYPGIRLGIGF